eukprot:CFRG6277T1
MLASNIFRATAVRTFGEVCSHSLFRQNVRCCRPVLQLRYNHNNAHNLSLPGVLLTHTDEFGGDKMRRDRNHWIGAGSAVRQNTEMFKGEASSYNVSPKLPMVNLYRSAKHTGQCAEAAAVVQHMLTTRTLRFEDGIAAINIFKLCGKPEKCMEVLAYLKKTMGTITASHYNPIIATFGEMKDLPSALELLYEMKKLEIRPDTVTYNSSISACAKGGHWERALELLKEMEIIGIPRNIRTYRTAISACEKAGQWDSAHSLMRVLNGVDGSLNTIINNTNIFAGDKDARQRSSAVISASHRQYTHLPSLFQIYMDAKETIMRVMYGVNASQNTIIDSTNVSADDKDARQRSSALISASHHQYTHLPSLFQIYMDAKARKQYGDAAWAARHQLEARTLKCNDGETAILIFKHFRAPSKCIDVLEYLKEKNCKLTASHYNPIIASFIATKDTASALRLLDEMKELGIKTNKITYDSTMAACTRKGDWQSARRLFYEMERIGIPRNTVTYNSMISACGKDGQWERALELLREMESTGIPRDTITYNSTISAYGKAGQLKGALELLREMEITGIPRDDVTYDSAISACQARSQWEAALGLLREMEKAEVPRSTRTYNNVIRACGTELELALALFSEMDNVGIDKNEITYRSIIEALGEHANMRDTIDKKYEDMLCMSNKLSKCWMQLKKTGILDLHDHSQYMAQAAVRRLLRILLDQESGTSYNKKVVLKSLLVGQRNRSWHRGPLLCRTIQKQLRTEIFPAIEASLCTQHAIMLVLDAKDLKTWLMSKQCI